MPWNQSLLKLDLLGENKWKQIDFFGLQMIYVMQPLNLPPILLCRLNYRRSAIWTKILSVASKGLLKIKIQF